MVGGRPLQWLVSWFMASGPPENSFRMGCLSGAPYVIQHRDNFIDTLPYLLQASW